MYSGRGLTSSYKNQKTLKKNFKRILKLTFEEKEVEEVYNIIDELSRKKEIEYAGPNYQLMCDSSAINTTTNYNSRTTTTVDENWGIDRINVLEAKKMIESITKKEVYVGVLEKGIDGSHPDLNISSNLSISFVEEDVYDEQISETNPLVDETADSHGTMVAGIIAAKENETEGTQGVCDDAVLISYKYATKEQYSNLSQTRGIVDGEDIVSAFNQASANNIKVMNCSFKFEVYDYSMEVAMSNYSGLIVCGSGNSFSNIDENPVYPASFELDNVLTVGAINSSNNIWYEIDNSTDIPVTIGSNFGKISVDVFAPGVDIKSTSKNNGYSIKSGTSYATPFVSGLAAMLLSIEEKTYSKHLSATELKGIIMNSVDVTSELVNYCVTGGVVNAEKTVELALSYVPSVSYSQYDSVYHIVEPTYGENYFEEHSYLPFLDMMGTVTPYALPGLPKFKCEKCGALKVGL